MKGHTADGPTTGAGECPFSTVIDPADDGSTVAFPVADRVHAEFLHRVGLPELLRPAGG